MNPKGIVPEGTFAGVPRLRHVSVESGIAWQKLPAAPHRQTAGHSGRHFR